MTVHLRGVLPPDVAQALSDLSNPLLHLDAKASVLSLNVRVDAGRWHLEPAPDRASAVATFGPAVIGSKEHPATDADLLDAIVTRLNRLAFGPDSRRLHLHAAGVEVGGTGVVLAGKSGSGKSTVAIELLQMGALYLTDECLTLLPGSSTVFAYPKPITLKAGSIERFARDPAHPVVQLASARNGRAHLQASVLSATAPFTTVGVVVALRYSDEDPQRFSPISAAAACVRLLGDSLDGVRLGPSALDVVSHIVAGASTWELVYRDAADAAALIAEIRPALRRRLVVPLRLTSSHRSGTRAETEPTSNVSADTSIRIARFEDSAALHDGWTRSLVVLDKPVVDQIEIGTAHGTSEIDTLAQALGGAPRAVRPKDPWAPLAFGLPNRPVGGLVEAPPIRNGHAAVVAHGRCTGVLADQLNRGRRPESASTLERIQTDHVAGQSTRLLLERELPLVVDLLVAANVEPLLTQGPVTAHDGPLPPHFCDFVDIALLVSPEQMNEAVEALQGAGFKRLFEQLPQEFDQRFATSVTFRGSFSGDWGRQPAPAFEVDLHRTLSPGPFGEFVPLGELHERAVPVRINGRWYRALHPDHRFVHACLHALLGSPDARLHSMRDVVTLAPQTPSGLDAVVEVAQAWRATAVVRRAVERVESLYPTALPPELVTAVRSCRLRRVERAYLATYHRPGLLYALPAAATVVALGRWRDRLEFVRSHLQHRLSSQHAKTRDETRRE